jgi:hypothetical protein
MSTQIARWDTQSYVTAAREQAEKMYQTALVDEWGDGYLTGREAAYAAVVGSLYFWVTGKEVHAAVADTEDGRTWGYVASYALDIGADEPNLFIEDTSPISAKISNLTDEEMVLLAIKYNW